VIFDLSTGDLNNQSVEILPFYKTTPVLIIYSLSLLCLD